MIRFVLGLMAMLALAACAEPKWAPDEAVTAAAFVQEGPKTITLYTVISNRSNKGEHSGLMINASQTVMFDPAGTWHSSTLPERNDVHYGINPKMEAFYVDYHARETFRVRKQTIVVTPEQAEIAMQRAMAYGAVPKAQCARATSYILSGVPGFEDINRTWFPNSLAAQFAKIPGVTEQIITDDDADKNHGVLLVQEQEVAAQ